VLTLGVAMPVAAGADAFEPNDFPDQARGPLAGGSPTVASIDTFNDEDWYYLYLLGGQIVTVTVTADPSCSGDSVLAELISADTSVLVTAVHTAGQTPRPARWTTPYSGPDSYRIHVTTGRITLPVIPCPYTLEITPANAVSNTSIADRKARCTSARLKYHRALLNYRNAKSAAEHHRRHASLTHLRKAVSQARSHVTTKCASKTLSRTPPTAAAASGDS
jgi:hypothetical protein